MSMIEHLAELWEKLDTPAFKSIFIGLNKEQVEELTEAAVKRQKTGQRLSPIDGELVAIKGNIALKGLPTSAGSIVYSTGVESENAPVVQRIIDAGGIPIGPANMTEFAFSGIGLNPHYGNAPNGADPTRVPGGSSAGSAAAISNGICDLAIGSDTSGSTRVPAAFQGTCGFRATMGRYPMEGVVPLAASLDVLGPMARDVDGIRTLDTIMHGSLPVDAALDIAQVRLVLPNLDGLGVSPDIMEMFERCADEISTKGIHVARRDISALMNTHQLFIEHGTLVSAEAREQICKFADLSDPKVDPQIRGRLEYALPMTLGRIAYLRKLRSVLQAEMAVQLRGDLLLMPTVPALPPLVETVAHDTAAFQEANALALRLTMITAFLNMPSLALPVDRAKPSHSVSVCGVALQDEAVLAAGKRIESALR